MIDWSWIQERETQTLLGILAIVSIIILFDRVLRHLLRKLLFSLSRDRDYWLYGFLRDERLVFWVLSIPYLAIIHQGLNWVPHLPNQAILIVHRITQSGFIVLSLLILTHALRVVNEIYSKLEVSKLRPIKGYLQSVLIVAYLLGSISIIATILGRSPILILSGLGALTAVLLLVFKDSILSLVAGVQLTANDLIRVGDWVEMPQFNADGDVIEIALHSVKIQNWDRTITVIPAHKFLENSFKNWRGMQDSGGRRIKRSLYIDVTSIRFLTPNDIEKFSRIKVLQNYMTQKSREIEHHNKLLKASGPVTSVDQRRLTNVGSFRAYISEYLQNHPKIHKSMTFLVRQLAPSPEGLPIEIYVFSNDIRWSAYEGIQADIFDHLIASMEEFDLKPYQRPSSYDLRHFTNEHENVSG